MKVEWEKGAILKFRQSFLPSRASKRKERKKEKDEKIEKKTVEDSRRQKRRWAGQNWICKSLGGAKIRLEKVRERF